MRGAMNQGEGRGSGRPAALGRIWGGARGGVIRVGGPQSAFLVFTKR